MAMTRGHAYKPSPIKCVTVYSQPIIDLDQFFQKRVEHISTGAKRVGDRVTIGPGHKAVTLSNRIIAIAETPKPVFRFPAFISLDETYILTYLNSMVLENG